MVNLFSLLTVSIPFVTGGDIDSRVTGKITNVECITTKGNFIVEVHEDWAPIGAPHFLDLVKDNFLTDIAIFRCVPKFLAQFGISADPEKKHWHSKVISDDPHKGEEIHGLKKYQVVAPTDLIINHFKSIIYD